MPDPDTKFRILKPVFAPNADRTEGQEGEAEEAWREANARTKVPGRPQDMPAPKTKAAR